MTQIRYDDLTEEEQARVHAYPFAQTQNGYGPALFVRDDCGELFGFREPAMFDQGEPVKWLDVVVSLETGKPVPLFGAKDLEQPAKPRAKRAAVVKSLADLPSMPAAAGWNTGEIVWMPHSTFEEWEFNPRTHFSPAQMTELKASLRAHGFKSSMSHLWARPHPTKEGKLQLIGGARRWRCSGELIAASEMPDSLPVVIEEMSDAKMLELALLDGVDREDLSPLDEAEGVCRLLDCAGEDGKPVHTGVSLAELMGRDASFIHRCKLLRKLRGTPAEKAIEDGTLTPRHGELLASIASAAIRDEMTGRVVNGSDGNIVSTRVLETWIQLEVRKELRTATFDPADPTLVDVRVDKAGERVMGGSCEDCPQNSKNMEAGKGQGKRAMCMNPECFRLKTDEAHRRWALSVPAENATALPPEDVTRVFGRDGVSMAPDCGLVDVEARPEDWELKKGMEAAAAPWKKLTLRQDVPEQWIKDVKGNVRRLIPRDAAIVAAVASGHDIFRRDPVVKEPRKQMDGVERLNKSIDRDQASESARKKQDAEQEEERIVWLAKIKALVLASSESDELPPLFWPTLFWYLSGGFFDGVKMAAERRGIESPAALERAAGKITGTPGAALFLEVVMHQAWHDDGVDPDEVIAEFGKVWGVDFKKVEKDARKELNQTRKAAAAAAAGKGSKEPETVRSKILKIAADLRMTPPDIEEIARHVVGRKFEDCKGPELVILETTFKELCTDRFYLWEQLSEPQRIYVKRVMNGVAFDTRQQFLIKSRAVETRAIESAAPATADRRFPVPNEHGIYDDVDAESVWLKTKKASAVVHLLEIGESDWAMSVCTQFPTTSSSRGLSANRETYTSREQALIFGLYEVRKFCSEAMRDGGGCGGKGLVTAAKAIEAQVTSWLEELPPIDKAAVRGEATPAPEVGHEERGTSNVVEVERVREALLAAGKKGLPIRDLAGIVGVTYKSLYVWAATAGKTVPWLKKVAPATYAVKVEKGGAK